jgi:hypothetical protein
MQILTFWWNKIPYSDLKIDEDMFSEIFVSITIADYGNYLSYMREEALQISFFLI